MILKINKVYKFENKLIFISDKRRFKKRLIYTIQKVNSSGALGPKIERTFKKRTCKLVSGCKVITFIKLPEKVKQRAQFQNLCKRAIKIIKGKKPNYKIEVAKLAHCCSDFSHSSSGRQCNLRDFARGVGFKSFNTLYRWVIDYYKGYYTDDKYSKAIPNAADSTIIKVVMDYQNSLNSYKGFNKQLDKILDKDVKGYIDELNLRNLQLQ